MPVATWKILTPPAGRGAIGVVQIRLQEQSGVGFFESLGLDIPVGRPRLRDLLGVDQGLAIRWDERTLDLFPHGGPAIVRRLGAALTALGLIEASGDEHAVYPEAGDEIEQRMLETLARAASPLAVDLLLDQPRRWREFVERAECVRQGRADRAKCQGPAARPPRSRHTSARSAEDDLADARVLGRLIDPPLVVAVGAANIGKSTLLNALAGRSVAVVADEPGTTRDHVGAVLDMAGLTVRYLDTPGRRSSVSSLEAEAVAICDQVSATADLLLLCGDPITPCPAGMAGPALLRVCLRSDLGEPGWPADIRVCGRDGTGLDELAGAIREILVPAEALADPRCWRFWGSFGS